MSMTIIEDIRSDEQATEAPVVGAGLPEAIAEALAGTKWECSADEMRPAR